MTWFKVDESFHRSRKVRRLGSDRLPAVGLWTLCGSWSVASSSGGFVPWEIVEWWDKSHVVAQRLIDVGLWREGVDNGERGVVFHQWRQHQQRDYRPRIPEDLRLAVYQRDGHACVSCGATEPLSLDHVWPWSLGGEDTFENLQTLCISCNCQKGARV